MGREGKAARHDCSLLQILWFELILEIALPVAFEMWKENLFSKSPKIFQSRFPSFICENSY